MWTAARVNGGRVIGHIKDKVFRFLKTGFHLLMHGRGNGAGHKVFDFQEKQGDQYVEKTNWRSSKIFSSHFNGNADRDGILVSDYVDFQRLRHSFSADSVCDVVGDSCHWNCVWLWHGVDSSWL